MFFKWIFYFCLLICIFVFLLGCVFALWCFLGLFCACKIFPQKNKNKKFKIALITSFILLLNFQLSWSFSVIAIVFNYYNLFQLSQFFSIITIFFNYHNFFQLLQSFPIIAILFNYNNFFQLSQLVTLSLWK